MRRRRPRADTVVLAVAGIAILALSMRLAALGQRVAHWDEGRVAYWLLRYAETGQWTYRPILHGPFVKHTTRFVFETLGPSDATMRLVVAVVGGLWPLSALCFRVPGRDVGLDDGETVALAVVLAANPLLVYFSRFLRSDVPLAAFAFVALGLGYRAVVTGRARYVLGSAAFLGLAATTKENALLYLASWAGAAALVGAAWLYHRPAPREALASAGGRALARLRSWARPLAAGSVLALVIFVGFYAPRAGGADAPGLWRAVFGDGSLGPVIVAATAGTVEKVGSLWLSGSLRGHAYAPYLLHYLVVLLVGGISTLAFAVVGVLDARRRSLVAFGAWWGLSAVVGYPFATDIKAPWLAVHAVVGFALPAAVGLAAVARRARESLATGDRRAALAFVGLLVLAGAHVGAVTVATSYTYPMPNENVIAQSGQPGSDLRPVLDRMERVGETNDGPDVLYYGDLAVEDERANDDPPAASGWYGRLPLPWYTERAHASVASAPDPAAMPADPPPVVVVRPSAEAEVAPHLDGYRRVERGILLLPENRTVSVAGYERTFGGRSLVFYVDREAAP